MSVHEMTAAMYYLLAQRRGERGSEPNGEHEAHAGNAPVSDEELSFLRRYDDISIVLRLFSASFIVHEYVRAQQSVVVVLEQYSWCVGGKLVWLGMRRLGSLCVCVIVFCQP